MAAMWTQVALWMLLQACLIGVSGRGRAGGRSGGYSSSRGSSYRSSGSTYRSSSTYRGSRLSSSYISYNPGARYSRAYTSARMGSYYFYYYNLYFYYVGTSAYYRRPAISQTATVCVNYETNDNDSYIGVFVCPLDFEPSEFTQCCGDEYAEFCCKGEGVNIIVIIGCGVLGLIVFVSLVICIRHLCIAKTHRGKVIAPPPGQRPPPGQGRPPGQGQPPGQGRPPGQGQPPGQGRPLGQGRAPPGPGYPSAPPHVEGPRQRFPQEPPNYGIFTVTDGRQEVKPPPYAMSGQPMSPPPAYSSEWLTHGAPPYPVMPGDCCGAPPYPVTTGDYQIPPYNPVPYNSPTVLPQPQSTAINQ